MKEKSLRYAHPVVFYSPIILPQPDNKEIYRIPPYCGACTYIRNHPIFQGEKSASYIGASLPVTYNAACTYIRNP